jgi:hypothetical protein
MTDYKEKLRYGGTEESLMYTDIIEAKYILTAVKGSTTTTSMFTTRDTGTDNPTFIWRSLKQLRRRDVAASG